MECARKLALKIPPPYVWALAVSAGLISLMSALQVVMARRAQYWVTHPVIIPFYERLLYAVAVFWEWLGTLGPVLVVSACASVASLSVALRPGARKR